MGLPDQPTPDILRLTTGSEQELEIIKRRDGFFQRVLADVGFEGWPLEDLPVSVIENSLGKECPEGFYPTDDKLHSLVVGHEVLALVFDRRNDNNNHEITFWSRKPGEAATAFLSQVEQAG